MHPLCNSPGKIGNTPMTGIFAALYAL